MTVPKDVIDKVVDATGLSEELVAKVAEQVWPVVSKASSIRPLCVWARLRCITTIGPVRRIIWCMLAILCVAR